jgi:two-component system KDP operon response regulator KdpE
VRTGELEIDLAAHVVRRAGAEVALSPKEFEILAVLAEKPGKVVRHAELLKSVWGSERADIQYLRVHVGQLRGKLEPDPADPHYLISDPGVGYRLALIEPMQECRCVRVSVESVAPAPLIRRCAPPSPTKGRRSMRT